MTPLRTTPLLRGALAGAAATVPMSAVLLAGDRLLPRQPPESITRAALHVVPVDVPEAAVRPLALAAHLGFGAALGAVTAVTRAPALVVALTAYAASYQGWVPALGILPPASADVPGRRQEGLHSHRRLQ